MQIAEVRFLWGWVCPVSFFPCMLPMPLVSPVLCYSHEYTHANVHIPSIQFWDDPH